MTEAAGLVHRVHGRVVGRAREIELVVAIGKGGRNIPVDKALGHVFGYGVGLDMTRRDLQTDAKKLQRPSVNLRIVRAGRPTIVPLKIAP